MHSLDSPDRVKGAEINLRANSPTFTSAKLNGFTSGVHLQRLQYSSLNDCSSVYIVKCVDDLSVCICVDYS